MGKWREAFQHGRPSPLDVEFGFEYTFGPPASGEQLDRAEAELGLQLPQEVRELLSEFNGVWVSSEESRSHADDPDVASDPDIAYLDVEHLAVHVPRYFRTCGNPLPPESDLRKVVFFYQENGFADLYGVCAENIAGFWTGEVVKLDHELGELETAFPTLLDFVRLGCRDWD